MGLISSKTTGSRKQRYENLSKFVCTDGGDELKIQIRRHICKFPIVGVYKKTRKSGMLWGAKHFGAA